MQGRLVGKRVSARLFQDDVAAHGAEACNYLLAVDVEMNTVDGYAMSSWETGYGDMVLMPDFDTLRLIPWLPGHRHRHGRPDQPRGRARSIPRPREILQAQLARLEEHGLDRLRRHRARVHRLRRQLPRGLGEGLHGTSPRRPTTTSTTRCSPRPAWSRCCATSASAWRAPACTARASRASATSASRRSRSATPRRSPPATTTRSTRTARKRSPTSTARR